VTLELNDRIREQLFKAFEDEHLYAIIDGASVPDIALILGTPNLASACLLRGELDSELARVAPYLLCLDQQPGLIDWILTDGWGKHWGIFLTTRADFRAMRQHARSLLQVYSPENQPLLFRFYDPRVLRTVLPTCDAEQLSQVFGPVRRFCMEAEDADSLVQCELVDGRLDCH
jgi:hypothetical protein